MTAPLISVRIPATSANLGSGFDTLGMALSLYNIFSITELLPRGEYRCETFGEGANELSDPKNNLVVKTILQTCEEWGADIPGFVLRSNNVIPLCRGLGSSAGAVVGGVLIAQALAGKEVDQQELLHLMTRAEGHPDNVAPCFLGGMVVSCWDGSELRYVSLPSLPEDMHIVVAVPDVRVKTSDAREALPESVSFQDAVFTLGRAALLTAAWATGKWDLLSWGMDDKLHQQYRAKLFPGGEAILDRVRQVPGCLATSISGSGPSVLALVRGKPRRVAEAMCSTFSEHGVRSLFFVLDGNGQGAHLEISLDYKSERERVMR